MQFDLSEPESRNEALLMQLSNAISNNVISTVDILKIVSQDSENWETIENGQVLSAKFVKHLENDKWLVLAELIVDEAKDLPTAENFTNWILCAGSVSAVVDNSELYVLNSKGEWELWEM